MRLQKIFVVFLFLLICSLTCADEGKHDWTFSKNNASQQVSDVTSVLYTWATAEYREHEGEGLFQRFPQDGQIIQATLGLVKELKQRAEQASENGDESEASALLFAAEATAHYATMMPHLLENRAAMQTQVSDQ